MTKTYTAEHVEKLIADFQLPQSPNNLYAPISYILSLGGKRVRSVVALQVANCIGLDERSAQKLALAIELFHNFTLVHDDIMDRADTRRGQITVHKKWNENIGILSGDAMLIEVYKTFLELDNTNTTALLKRFNHIGTLVCEGQQYDMDFESDADVSEADYLEMIRLKTAVLLGFSMESAALLMGDNALAKQLYHIGECIGMSFQIKDDLLDAFPEGDGFGKQVGGDILAGKKTLLYLSALHHANEVDKSQLNKIYSANTRNDSDVQLVKDIMLKYQVPSKVSKVAEDYQKQVETSLKSIQHEALKSFLFDFSNQLLSRKV